MFCSFISLIVKYLENYADKKDYFVSSNVFFFIFYSNMQEKEVTGDANNENIAKRLWLTSEKWTRLTD